MTLADLRGDYNYLLIANFKLVLFIGSNSEILILNLGSFKASVLDSLREFIRTYELTTFSSLESLAGSLYSMCWSYSLIPVVSYPEVTLISYTDFEVYSSRYSSYFLLVSLSIDLLSSSPGLAFSSGFLPFLAFQPIIMPDELKLYLISVNLGELCENTMLFLGVS